LGAALDSVGASNVYLVGALIQTILINRLEMTSHLLFMSNAERYKLITTNKTTHYML
jgi:hypothetical protein